jgi:hypothetical protein
VSEDQHEEKVGAAALLPAPTIEQQSLIDDVARIYLQHGKWPTWQWLDETVERGGLDATSILATLPRTGSYGYGYLRQLNPSPQPLSEVRLTIAGLSKVENAKERVSAFIKFVGVIGTLRSKVILDPFGQDQPMIAKSDVLSVIFPSMAVGEELLELLTGEPPLWNSQVMQQDESGWILLYVPPGTRRFAGVNSTEHYFKVFSEFLVTTEEPVDDTFVSPFMLPASIDYLDAVWQNRFQQPLVVPPGVERSARLAFTASNVEEADSRLSALAELLKNLNVPGTPGVDGHPLKRMKAFLLEALPSEAHGRVTYAIEILDAARGMRVGGQHYGVSPRTIAACAQLGIAYPVSDWSAAWARIQSKATAAVDAIRDEIQASQQIESAWVFRRLV